LSEISWQTVLHDWPANGKTAVSVVCPRKWNSKLTGHGRLIDWLTTKCARQFNSQQSKLDIELNIRLPLVSQSNCDVNASCVGTPSRSVLAVCDGGRRPWGGGARDNNFRENLLLTMLSLLELRDDASDYIELRAKRGKGGT